MLDIAVIVANRNNGRFLKQCLESIICQSARPREIIVVDDASTDDSLHILAPYARDGIVTLVQNQSQKGVATTRHLGITSSTSGYITTLDSDDFFAGKDKLAAEADAIGSSPRTGRIAFSDVMRVTESGEEIGLVSGYRKIREGDLSFRIRHLSGFIPRDYLVSREDYFAAGGFDPSFRIYEDWDLKIRLSRRCTWHFSSTVGTAYRQNPAGLSRASRKEHVETMRRIFVKYCPAKGRFARDLSFARFFVYHSLYFRRPAFA
jgi:glycosyltransferase involved in cell wall biosynthesis